MGDYEGNLKTKNDVMGMKKKLILTRFRGNFGTSRFDGKSFFNTRPSFTPHWDYKPTNAIHALSTDVYTSEKNFQLKYSR